MPSDVPKGAPAPRLCHLVKWPDFDGYGFNLHAEKTKSGQFIGKVDRGSPAELAGLREGDRIIEVNDVNIGNENHKQVVERIKAIVNETKLLVLDDAADAFYKGKKIVVKGTLSNVQIMKTPVPRPDAENGEQIDGTGADKDDSSDGRKSIPDSEQDDRGSRSSSVSNGAGDNTSQTSQTGSRLSTPSADGMELTHADVRGDTPSPTTPPINGTSNGKGLNLNMTAAEMRALLANRKKHDPKKENLDLRTKYSMIQEM